VCAVIGEFSELNQECWIRPDEQNPDKTTNILLQYLCNKDDEQLWTFMEDVTFQLVDHLSRSDLKEYWSSATQSWAVRQPDHQQMRIRGVVHEASSTFVGPECEGGSLDDFYRPYGCNNVVCYCAVASYLYSILTDPILVCYRCGCLTYGGCVEPNTTYVCIFAGSCEEVTLRGY
jgi:hypothetical protein